MTYNPFFMLWLGNSKLGAKSTLPPVLYIKFYWNTATFEFSHIVSGSFHATVAELSDYDRDHMVHNA